MDNRYAVIEYRIVPVQKAIVHAVYSDRDLAVQDARRLESPAMGGWFAVNGVNVETPLGRDILAGLAGGGVVTIMADSNGEPFIVG